MTKTRYPTIDEKVKNSIEELRLTPEQISKLEEKYFPAVVRPDENYSAAIGSLYYLLNGLACAIVYDQAQKYLNSGRSLDEFKQDWGITSNPSTYRHDSQRYAIGFSAKKLCELVYIPEVGYNSIGLPDFGYGIPEGLGGINPATKVTKTSDYTRFYFFGSANVIEEIEIVTSILMNKGSTDILESVAGISEVGHKLESTPNPIIEDFLNEGLQLGKGLFRLYAEEKRMKTKPGYPYAGALKKPELVLDLLDYYQRVIDSI